ncbi:MAG: UDP-glucose 4-epimerase GalE [Ramlibacter sp.]|nr:UDP-glucose 4-epimerase GalE [Ramlibacter sp.]
MKPVLVTGGAGYIGSHACKALANAGYLPLAYDNLLHGNRHAVRWGPLIEGDILDRSVLDATLSKWKPVAVMHFAAFAYVGESVSDPGKYYRNNVGGTLSLLEAMRDGGFNRLIFSSTCATYGAPQADVLDESHPQNPINPYGASKLMAERMLRDFDAAHGLKSISLRYFNAAGADAAGEIGETHEPETHLIPLVLDAASGRRSHVTVYGNQYPTPDGTCIRDYIHVTDLAEAHLCAMRALLDGAETTAYNLGNGNGYSVKQVIATVELVTGRSVGVRLGEGRVGDPHQLVGDATRIRQELGWRPAHPDLADIISTAWRWHQKLEGPP